jgi:hypothetical protein
LKQVKLHGDCNSFRQRLRVVVAGKTKFTISAVTTGSKHNGISVNYTRVIEKCLRHGDIISFGGGSKTDVGVHNPNTKTRTDLHYRFIVNPRLVHDDGDETKSDDEVRSDNTASDMARLARSSALPELHAKPAGKANGHKRERPATRTSAQLDVRACVTCARTSCKLLFLFLSQSTPPAKKALMSDDMDRCACDNCVAAISIVSRVVSVQERPNDAERLSICCERARAMTLTACSHERVQWCRLVPYVKHSH